MPVLLSPLFLVAAVAAAAPIVLHLLHRRNPKPFPFSTLRFLQAAVAKTRRSHHVTQFLLLLLRVLIILLLALAFARPRLPAGGFLPEGPRTIVLVVDSSASMQCADGEGTRFVSARDWALSLLGSLDDRDRVALVMPGQAEPLAIFPAVTNQGMIRQSLSNSSCGFGRVNLVASLRDLLRQTREAHGRETVEIHVFSDFQSTAWVSAEVADLGEQLAEADVRLFLNHVGATDVPNAALGTLRLTPEALLGDGRVEARFTITSNAQFDGANVARLIVDGQEMEQRGLTLYPDTSDTLRLAALVSTDAETVSGRVQLEPDALAVDNARYFILERRDFIPILLVNGLPGQGELSESYYIARAMNPSNLPSPLIRPTTLDIGSLASTDLSTYAGVFIANPPALTDDQALKLEQYAADGGLVVLYPGSQAGLPQSLARLKPLAGLTAQALRRDETGRLRSLRSDRPSDMELQVASILGGRLPEVMGTQHLAYREPPDSATYYFAIDGADPLAVHVPHGHGSIWVTATSANRAWSEWPLSPDFVIFHQLLVRQHIGGTSGLRGVDVGDPAELRWSGEELELTVDVTQPDGRTRVVTLSRSDATDAFLIPAMEQPGGHELNLRSSPPARRHLAVNVPTDESILTAVSAAELSADLAPAEVYQPSDFRDMQAMLADLTRGAPLWPWLLLAAFMLAICEELLANWRSWSQGIPDALTHMLRMRRG